MTTPLHYEYSTTYLADKMRRLVRTGFNWAVGLTTFFLAVSGFAALVAWFVSMFVGS